MSANKHSSRRRSATDYSRLTRRQRRAERAYVWQCAMRRADRPDIREEKPME